MAHPTDCFKCIYLNFFHESLYDNSTNSSYYNENNFINETCKSEKSDKLKYNLESPELFNKCSYTKEKKEKINQYIQNFRKTTKYKQKGKIELSLQKIDGFYNQENFYCHFS